MVWWSVCVCVRVCVGGGVVCVCVWCGGGGVCVCMCVVCVVWWCVYLCV